MRNLALLKWKLLFTFNGWISLEINANCFYSFFSFILIYFILSSIIITLSSVRCGVSMWFVSEQYLVTGFGALSPLSWSLWCEDVEIEAPLGHNWPLTPRGKRRNTISCYHTQYRFLFRCVNWYLSFSFHVAACMPFLPHHTFFGWMTGKILQH